MKKMILGIMIALACSSTVFASNDVLWYTQSAERIAIDREVFFMAGNTLKAKVKAEHLKPKSWGVILDIDETVLNNSGWNTNKIADPNYNKTWDEFAATAQSTAIPGAAEFTRLIHTLGGYVNLASNRNGNLKEATLKNLREQHIYFDQVLLDETKEGTSFVNKNERFKAIIAGKKPSTLPPQKIIAWLGDNIQDFPNLKQKTISKDPDSTQYDLFGQSYFIFPNPMYGSFEVKE